MNKTYKQTSIGRIPNDWEVKKLGEVSIIQGDYGINASAVEYSDGLPTYLRITDIDEEGNYCDKNKVSVDDVNYKNFILKNNDFVFARTGASVGKTYLHNSKLNGDLVFAGFLIRFRVDEKKIFPYYLKIFTQTNKYWNWVNVFSMRSGQPGINSREYCNLQLPLPPLPEQEAIAACLSTWDTAIEKQSQLINALQQRKKALMQQLLTGKKRLLNPKNNQPFSHPWKEVKLGEVGNIVTGNTPSKNNSDYWNGEFNWCTAEDMKDKYVYNTNQKLTDLGKMNARVVKVNSVLVTCIASIGVNAINKVDCAFNQQINSITPYENYNTEFIYYLIEFSTPILLKFAGAGALPMLNKNTFSNIKLKFPPLDEQTAIAEVLSTADEELALQKQLLVQYQQQKKALMQQLLTGKKRLRIEN